MSKKGFVLILLLLVVAAIFVNVLGLIALAMGVGGLFFIMYATQYRVGSRIWKRLIALGLGMFVLSLTILFFPASLIPEWLKEFLSFSFRSALEEMFQFMR